MNKFEYIIRLRDTLRNHLNGYDPQKLRIQVQCKLYYQIIHDNKDIIHVSDDEDEVREIFKGITGKAYTRELSIDRRDYDS